MSGGSSKTLLLDTNVFIQAHQRYYAQDICPAFWRSLLCHYRRNSLISLDRVKDEIKVGKDQLWDWAKVMPAGMFASSTAPNIQVTYGQIINWVNGQRFIINGINKFAAGADGWLVAYAMVHDMIVVTDEQPNPNVKRRVPIPNVCQQFGVSYIDTFSMLRNLRIQFKA